MAPTRFHRPPPMQKEHAHWCENYNKLVYISNALLLPRNVQDTGIAIGSGAGHVGLISQSRALWKLFARAQNKHFLPGDLLVIALHAQTFFFFFVFWFIWHNFIQCFGYLFLIYFYLFIFFLSEPAERKSLHKMACQTEVEKTQLPDSANHFLVFSRSRLGQKAAKTPKCWAKSFVTNVKSSPRKKFSPHAKCIWPKRIHRNKGNSTEVAWRNVCVLWSKNLEKFHLSEANCDFSFSW